MPKLAAFPKAYMDPLCVDGTMTVREWVELAATLDIDGLEFYSGFLELKDPRQLGAVRGAWSKTRACAIPDALLLARLHASRPGVSASSRSTWKKAGST